MNKRVVITGFGIVSSIGNNEKEVLESLRAGKSGIVHAAEYQDLGFRSLVHGAVYPIDLEAAIDKKKRRFMGDGIAYGYLAMEQAVTMAGLEGRDLQSPRTGLVVGAGGPSASTIVNCADVTRENKSPKRVGPFAVPKAMSSGPSANLVTSFGIKGIAYTLSSACATAKHCIGHGMQLIQSGLQDIVVAGATEELHWTLSLLFDAMGALSTKYNDTPATASRPFDESRDGFVIAGGAGIVILEEYEHAKARGAKIYAELVGYGATSDGADMVAPSGEGGVRCMRMALEGVKAKIDYINPHATSTPVGDKKEVEALREVFGKEIPPLSATKAMTGHSLGATGAQELIFCILMMQNRFICPSINIGKLDPEFVDLPIVQERKDNVDLEYVLSNSFGFGGANATLVLRKL